MTDRDKKSMQRIQSHFFMYPCADGYRWAGMSHTLIETCDAFISWALGHNYDLIDIAYTVAIHTGKDIVDEFARVFDIKIDRDAWMDAAIADGTMDTLMHHGQVWDYPTREWQD